MVDVLADAIDRYKGRRRGSKLSNTCAKNLMFALFYYKLTRAVVDHKARTQTTEREFLQATFDCWLRAIEADC
jgi:hypothetical protein